MIKIVHIITGLAGGGAENMLSKLLKYSDREMYYHEVISLIDEGIYGNMIKESGAKVHSLNLNKNNIIPSIIKARNICRQFDIIDTWLYHADLFGFLIAKILSNKKLIWNIRRSNLDKQFNKPSILRIAKLNSLLSKYVDCITYNSNKALENHLIFGYSNKKSVIVPNGFELDKFRFDLESRVKVRTEFEIGANQSVIVTVGRWDVQKDYHTLLKALSELRKYNVDFKMLMCGSNLDYSNSELVSMVDKWELRDSVILLGRREDIPSVLSAADIYVSSSIGESFSNSIGEAMACELPCIVTDVGDSRLIVGDTGVVVEPQDHIALCNAIASHINDETLFNRLAKARTRVIENYDIKTIVKQYALYY